MKIIFYRSITVILIGVILLSGYFNAKNSKSSRNFKKAFSKNYRNHSAFKHPMCANGKAQSPVNLVATPGSKLKIRHLKILYDKVAGKMRWDKRLNTFGIRIPDQSMKVQLTVRHGRSHRIINYFLQAIVFRFPTEHTIMGKHSAMEIQFYHKILKPMERFNFHRVAFSIFVDPDDNNTDKLLENVQPGDDANFDNIINSLNSAPFFEYFGSLTFPPCTQDVVWVVFTKQFKMEKNLLNSLVAFAKQKTGKNNNGRPVNPPHMRKLYQYGEIDQGFGSTSAFIKNQKKTQQQTQTQTQTQTQAQTLNKPNPK